VKILVTGGRDYANQGVVHRVLSEYIDQQPIIMEGGANGADALANWFALRNHLECQTFDADWDKHGKAAGPKRNRLMLDHAPDLVIAFPGGKGTANCVAQAEKRGIPVRHVT
jgi:hypothetical protein